MVIAALLLATKVEENSKSLQDITRRCIAYRFSERAQQERMNRSPMKDQLRENVLYGERVLMYTVGFHFDVEHPHSHIGKIMEILNLDPEERDVQDRPEELHLRRFILQVAWNVATEAMYTPVCLQFPPNVIAAACVFIAQQITEGHKISTTTTTMTMGGQEKGEDNTESKKRAELFADTQKKAVRRLTLKLRGNDLIRRSFTTTSGGTEDNQRKSASASASASPPLPPLAEMIKSVKDQILAIFVLPSGPGAAPHERINPNATNGGEPVEL